MKIPWIMTCVWLISMLAVGFCMKCEEVNVTEDGNATLPYATSGLTNFYKIDCKTENKIDHIACYCGPGYNCNNMTRNVSFEHEGVILHVTSNTCYMAEPIPGEKKCYVTIKKPLPSTISPKIPNSKLSTATPLNNSISDPPSASNQTAGEPTSSPKIPNSKSSTATPLYTTLVVFLVLSLLSVLFLLVLAVKNARSKWRYRQVNAALKRQGENTTLTLELQRNEKNEKPTVQIETTLVVWKEKRKRPTHFLHVNETQL